MVMLEIPRNNFCALLLKSQASVRLINEHSLKQIKMTVDIRIGYLTTLYHTSFILIGSNILEAQGIKASWKLFPNGPAMMEAFQRKELDMGYIGLPPVMIGIGRGLKIKCVAGGHVEGTVLIGGPDFQASRTPREALLQFKGKSIGTPKSGTIHDVILRKLIKDSGLADDITSQEL